MTREFYGRKWSFKLFQYIVLSTREVSRETEHLFSLYNSETFFFHLLIMKWSNGREHLRVCLTRFHISRHLNFFTSSSQILIMSVYKPLNFTKFNMSLYLNYFHMQPDYLRKTSSTRFVDTCQNRILLLSSNTSPIL